MVLFFDTNILFYAVDGRFPEKQAIALSLYTQATTQGSFATSAQVLSEFYNATTKGIAPLLQCSQARIQVASLARQRVVATTASMVAQATALAERHQLQWWDAMVLQAALSVGATCLYSEDFQHGQRFDTLTTVNPFTTL